MPLSLPIDADANELLSASPLALLIGMLLDQQVTIEKAFTTPTRPGAPARPRADGRGTGRVRPGGAAAIFSERPALHRYPRAMAGRVQQLCQHIVDRYGGDPAAVWTGAQAPAPSCWRGSASCPGSARTRRRSSWPCSASSTACGRRGWREAAGHFGEKGSHYSVADIVDAQSLAAVRAYKQNKKAAAKAAAGV